MPVYEYECSDCGPFQALRSMSEYATPCPCPQCGGSAPRVLLTAPAFGGMSQGLRLAHATNERSAHEPRLASAGKAHGSGCSCCSGGGRKKSSAVYRADGSKTFPSKRPWMISH